MRFLVSILVVFGLAASLPGQTPQPVGLDGLPGPLQWQNPPADSHVDPGQRLLIPAGTGTDWFVSPMDGARRDNSPRLLFHPADDFVLSAKVTVDFRSQWDGGGLVLYSSGDLWAKFGVEKTVEQQPTIVSVVTRTLSDDNNSIPVRGASVYLRIAKAGQAIFFYASEDGKKWTIIRAFSLGPVTGLRVGFTSQSPLGEGCTTAFNEIRYTARRVNLWTGE